MAVNFRLLPLGGACVPITGRQAPVVLRVASVILPGTTILRARHPVIASGVQTLAQVILCHLCLSQCHFPVDERLLMRGGASTVTPPQLLPLISRICSEPLSPQTVPHGLVTLPSAVVTEPRPVVTILSVLIAPPRTRVPSVSGLVAFGAVALRVHPMTVPRLQVDSAADRVTKEPSDAFGLVHAACFAPLEPRTHLGCLFH